MSAPPEAAGGTPPNRCPSCGLAVSPWALLCPRDGTQLQPESPGAAEVEPTFVRPSDWERTVIRDLLVGRKIGEYEVVRRIGNGGMGIVYEGRHPALNRKVAIKVLRPELTASEHLASLREEARAANAIRHRGIIDVFGFGQLDGVGQYIVMDFLEGEPLDQVIAERAPLPLATVVDILDELLDALGAAHAGGVIHRDLKPSNVFLVRQTGGSRAVKVLDFGLAKRAERGGGGQARQSVVAGTPEYMAPEQARGLDIGPSADLYAVGCIAFELLTGKLPFDGAQPIEIALKHINDPIPTPSSLAEEVPAEIDAFVSRLLAKEPSKRYPSAEVARRELQGIWNRRAWAQTAKQPPLRGESAPDKTQPVARDTTQAVAPDKTQPVAPIAHTPSRAKGRRPIALAAGVLGMGLLALLVLSTVFRSRQLDEATTAKSNEERSAVTATSIEAKSAEPLKTVDPEQRADTQRSPGETLKHEDPPQDMAPVRVPVSKPIVSVHKPPHGIAKKTKEEAVPQVTAKTGTLVIDVAPFWANLTLNGKAQGYVNRTREFVLPPGEYELRLQHTDFSHTARVTVSAGQTVTVKPAWK